jgi:hypothetical protein
MATNTVHSQQVKKNRGLNSSPQLPLINAPYRKFTKLAVTNTVHVKAMACRLPYVLGRKKWSLSDRVRQREKQRQEIRFVLE